MSHESIERSAQPTAGELAPFWHTAALVTLIVAVAITGTLLRAQSAGTRGAPLAPGSRILTQYAPMLLVNWGLTAYVSRLFRARNALSDLLGRGWQRSAQVVLDLALALAVFAFILALEALTAHALARRNAALQALLPSTEAERLTWLLVALSVGFCEEVVYRGYLQRQLSAFTGRVSFGVMLQALLFGIAHAEQGLGSAWRIALYGLVLGVLASFRRSLLPGIVCHVALDLASALR